VAEVTRKRTGEILQTVLEVLEEHPDGLQARRVIQEVERRLPPTPFEQSDYPSTPGVRRFDKIVRFATIAPVKAGWIVKWTFRNRLSGLLEGVGRLLGCSRP
jgi:restriction system protein